MFDRIVVQPRPQRIYNHTEIIEKRAPTDESVRILKELEEKAASKVLSAVAVESNAFKCVVQFHMDSASDRFVAVAIFELNGTKLAVEESVWAGEQDRDRAIVAKLSDAVAQKIAGTILMQALSSMPRKAFP
jgi:hypothetical protein